MLNNQLVLNQSYTNFLNNFTIYASQKEARAKGFEAHHIIPKAIQLQKSNNIYDDRCIRVTYFEHILAHYLLAKEYKGYYAYIFYGMISFRSKKISSIEKVTLQDLEEYANLKEIALKTQSEKHLGKAPWNKGKKFSLEHICNLKLSHKGYHWYNNGIRDIQSKEYPGDGWKSGRLPKSKKSIQKNIESRKGKKLPPASEARKARISRANKEFRKNNPYHWYTNGIDNIQVLEGDSIPDGFKKGRKMSEDFIRKASLKQKGLKNSEKTKKLKSEKRKNYLKTHKNPMSKEVIDIETGKIYPSINEGLRALGFSKSSYNKYKNNAYSKYFRLKPYQSLWISYSTLLSLPLLEESSVVDSVLDESLD